MSNLSGHLLNTGLESICLGSSDQEIVTVLAQICPLVGAPCTMTHGLVPAIKVNEHRQGKHSLLATRLIFAAGSLGHKSSIHSSLASRNQVKEMSLADTSDKCLRTGNRGHKDKLCLAHYHEAMGENGTQACRS